MKESTSFCIKNPLTKWDLAIVVLCILVVVGVMVLAFVPKPYAETATVYVDGKAVSTIGLMDEYNHVAIYNGVLVRVSDGVLQTVYRDQVASLFHAGDRIIYPTLGVEVKLA